VTANPRGLRVIGAGFGRTGTSSLKRALELLGFDPCYHMEEVIRNPPHVPVWEAASTGQSVDWKQLFDGWGAAVDFPAALYYQELMEAYPDAKVVLSTRDPEAWYTSMSQTIHPMLSRFPNRYVGPWLPFVGGPFRAMGQTRLRRELLDRFADRDHVLEVFRAREAEIQRVVPPERLLVYEVKQGWEPLCRFLDMPVPDVPFPRVNDAATFRRRANGVTALSWAVVLAPLVALAGLVAWLR
jgi:hypothetical protein